MTPPYVRPRRNRVALSTRAVAALVLYLLVAGLTYGCAVLWAR